MRVLKKTNDQIKIEGGCFFVTGLKTESMRRIHIHCNAWATPKHARIFAKWLMDRAEELEKGVKR